MYLKSDTFADISYRRHADSDALFDVSDIWNDTPFPSLSQIEFAEMLVLNIANKITDSYITCADHQSSRTMLQTDNSIYFAPTINNVSDKLAKQL